MFQLDDFEIFSWKTKNWLEFKLDDFLNGCLTKYPLRKLLFNQISIKKIVV